MLKQTDVLHHTFFIRRVAKLLNNILMWMESFLFFQINISIMCALISTPPTILVIYLFKLSKRNLPKHSENIFMPRRARKYTVPLWDHWVNKKLNKSMELEQSLVLKGFPPMQVNRKQFRHVYAYLLWLRRTDTLPGLITLSAFCPLLKRDFLYKENKYSRLSLSRSCLSPITTYLEVKIWSLF